MPLGDVDVLFTSDDASVLRALAAQERAVRQAAGKMEREWNQATEKASKQLLGFTNAGKAAMYGVGAGVALGYKAMSDYAHLSKSVGDEFDVIKRAGTDAWTSIGRSISGAIVGRSTQIRTFTNQFMSGLTAVQNVTADVFTAIAHGRVQQGESAADYDRAMQLQEQADKFTATLVGLPERRIAFEGRKGQLALDIKGGDEFAVARAKANLEADNTRDMLRQKRKDNKLEPSEYAALQVEAHLTVAKKLKDIDDAELESWMRINDAIDRAYNAKVEYEIEQDREKASARELLAFRRAEFEIDRLRAQGQGEAADRAEIELSYAKQALDISRESFATERDRQATIAALGTSKDAALRALGDQRGPASSGRGINVGVGSAGIANAVLAAAGRRDVGIEVQKGNQILREIKDILQRNPGTATFGSR